MPATRALELPQKPRRTLSANRVLYPLDTLYARAGVPPPTVKLTTADRIPAPYQGLLVHENEMTATLERHFGGPVTVRVLSKFSSGRSYFRRVLLALKSTGRPVAMGAVRLRLDAFKPAIRARILAGNVPLGRVLSDAKIRYLSRPTCFLEVTPNPEMLGVFWMPESKTISAVGLRSAWPVRKSVTLSKSSRWSEHRIRRRVQFHETDAAGIVHFSVFFRYMEEAEHALWREAGISIARGTGPIGFPRVTVGFDFHRALRFEDEFDIWIGITAIDQKTIRYVCRLTRNDEPIATGTMTIICVSRRPDEPMRAMAIPEDIVSRFAVATSDIP